ncbi:hypothetical protein ACFL1Z_01270 [Thermodesulfobacteriota bacterium]
MGAERTWRRKHLLIYIAGVLMMFLVVEGCSLLPGSLTYDYWFRKADGYVDEGNYQASLHENEVILEQFPETLGDQALLRMGLIYINPDFEKNDDEKALVSFQRILIDYPESHARVEAQLWVLMIEQMKQKVNQIQELENRISNLQSVVDAQISQDDKLVNLQSALDAKMSQDDKLVNSLNGCKSEKKALQDDLAVIKGELKKLEAQLELFKDVDMSVEKKKREELP